MFKPYTDPTTGEWVGEYETRGADGEVRRQTEWFNNETAARSFARTGRKGTDYKPDECSDCQELGRACGR